MDFAIIEAVLNGVNCEKARNYDFDKVVND